MHRRILFINQLNSFTLRQTSTNPDFSNITLGNVIYDKKPVKMTLEAGKLYHWCPCGRSKKQPMCDGTHKDAALKITERTIIIISVCGLVVWYLNLQLEGCGFESNSIRPLKFKVEETKEYWLCNCKKTKNRPFCDGTHKCSEIQEATTVVA